ncbi:hypothetical protein MUK42_20359 [Musa troglodytarum]|uniref:Uncharacterized protein n=1 Tax=Musa troglodytarum TaxID=320322 RepID=A0A9E7FXY1_9LILI|nr:hypothetical protein MUK42_20359 [Musa troglodytarum]
MGGSPPAMPPRRAIEEAHPPDRSRTGEPSARPRRTLVEEEQVRVGRRALEAVLENRRTALELLENADVDPDSAARGEEGSPPMPMRISVMRLIAAVGCFVGRLIHVYRLPGNKLEDRSAGNIFITEHRYSLGSLAAY